MNGSGPVGQGQSTGRELGNCSNLTNEEEKLEKLGVGMGKRRKGWGGGTGKKKRKQEGNQ